MKRVKVFSSILLIMLTASCNPVNNKPLTPAISPISPQITPTASPLPKSTLDIQCLDVLTEMPSTARISGNIILAEQDLYHSAYILHMNGSKTFLPRNADEMLNFFAVSPNSQWIAYYAENITNEDASRLIVLDANGDQVLSKPTSKREWWAIDSWIDNKRLLIDKYQSTPDISLATPLPVIVFNPFTGEEHELIPSYPDMVELYPSFDWQEYGFSAAGYDPTLSLVAYARKDGKIVLWDIQSKHVINTIQSAANFGDGPVWFSDGSRFIIDSIPGDPFAPAEDFWREELYTVDRDGIVSRITYLTNQFAGVSISGYQWSPDGNHVALWLTVKPDNFPDLPSGLPTVGRLAVVDMTNQKITLYCVPGSSNISPIVWSPDGKQMLVNNMSGTTYETVLVDMEEGYATKIAENTIPLGWMISKP
jgi:WD40 repeat protein